MNRLYFFLIVFIVLAFGNVKAANYVVTSTVDTSANDGVSLRWAVTEAIANTGPDTITFNIPGKAPHTISLVSDLPQIRGYDAQGTVIDGSTQPANGYTGISPKIIIDGGGICNNGFDIEIPDCEVYGLVITRFMTNGITLTEDVFNSTAADNFIIGAPGKGNVIFNMDTSSSPYTTGIGVGGIVYYGIHGGKIQSNKIGTDSSGKVSFPMYQGINIYNAALDTTRNILIGGGGAGEGNLISVEGAYQGNNVYISGAHTVTLKGNIIGADITGNKIWGNTAVTGIYVFAGADSCTIGGTLPGEGNVIAYVEDTVSHHGVGIEVQASDRCVMRRNSIYCNGNWGSIEMIGGNVCGGCFLSYAPPVITAADTSGVSGTASPNDVVELFYNNTGCTHPAYFCSGEIYIATVIANGAGNWSYTGTINAGTTLTATATSLDSGRTSAFADCFALPGPPPVASFNAASTSFCQGDCIGFTNLSQGNVLNEWIFNGGFPHASVYVNPATVCYDTAGYFDVTLIVTNNDGLTDTLTLANYIHVIPGPPAPVISVSHDTLYCSYDSAYHTYQWYADTALITGGTLPYLVFSSSGNYNIKVSNASGCFTATGITVTVGLEPFTVYGLQFTVYPNPVGNKLIINPFAAGGEIKECNIYNLLGEKVYASSPLFWRGAGGEAAIDVSSLPSGIYFLAIQNDRSRQIARFVKE